MEVRVVMLVRTAAAITATKRVLILGSAVLDAVNNSALFESLEGAVKCNPIAIECIA